MLRAVQQRRYQSRNSGGAGSRSLSERQPCVLGVQPTDHRVDLFQVELEDVCMSMNVVPFFAKLDVDSVATHGPSGSVPEDM